METSSSEYEKDQTHNVFIWSHNGLACKKMSSEDYAEQEALEFQEESAVEVIYDW
jgi:hypothetical protein